MNFLEWILGRWSGSFRASWILTRLGRGSFLALMLPVSPLVGLTAPRPNVTLDGSAARLVVDLAGGSIGDFHLKEVALNPLGWGTPSATDSGLRGFGHFLCLDRWGPPSEAEGARGMPYHGEAAHVLWQTVQEPRAEAGTVAAEMSAQLPIAGLSVRRQIRLSATQPVVLVREEITNDRPLGRIFNIVQHPTIAPPFLDATTVVDCNGRKGFAQGNPMPHPAEPSFHWPTALNQDGAPVNLRLLTDNPEPNVVSYAIEDRHGWVTAANPGKGLLLGYLWKTTDYPWVSLWRDVRDGKPAARGLEFGSTGLHQPYPVLVQVGRLWDRPLFEFLDAGETRTKSYLMFLLKVSPDFRGVKQVILEDQRLRVLERGDPRPRELTIEVAEGLQP
ncbi:MAG TPA: hypothetical protein PLX89_12130 [Verrucomicrobiota bacterium]|nr:hypothetical protein [Verrucomicrobiales bacterium]HRI13740.1 hypothetical protein [Verrucomicrobiota bacterium]